MKKFNKGVIKLNDCEEILKQKNSHNTLLFLWVLVLVFCGGNVLGQMPVQWSSAEIYHEMTKLPVLGKVLYLAAHPDDENTRFISYCANELKMQTAYLSLTRGDGGQNLLGAEVGPELGMIRTQELLEARKIDGAQQFFSRALDFGYSKTYTETFDIWGKEDILADVVWVIRTFKPDIIVCRFPPDGRGGHGHHTASAILGMEAFKQAADPTKFINQLKHTEVWQPKRLLINTGRWWNSEISANDQGVVALDVGTYNSTLGQSYSEIAALSRSQHKSQGFGTTGVRGELLEYFEHLDGDTAKFDLSEGIETSWKRVQGSSKIEKAIKKMLDHFSPQCPEKSVPALLAILKQINQLTSSKNTKNQENLRWLENKKNAIEKIVVQCMGLYSVAHADDFYKTEGDSLTINFEWINRSNVNAKILNIKCDDLNFEQSTEKLLEKHQLQQWQVNFVVPKIEKSQPIWLKNAPIGGLQPIADLDDRVRAENEAVFSFNISLRIENHIIKLSIPVTYQWKDPVKGEMHRPFIIVPKFSGKLQTDLAFFTQSDTQQLELIVYRHSDEIKANISAAIPTGWTIIMPDEVSFEKGERAKKVAITVIPPEKSAQGVLQFQLNNEPLVAWNTIEYDHIKTLDWFPKAAVKLVYEDIKTTKQKIGYVEGAGDKVPQALRLLGYEVEMLTNSDLLSTDLSQYQTIITGIRFLNVNEKSDIWMQELLEYVKTGGNLILQYNTRHALKTNVFSPYPIELSRDRVTEEDAKVIILDTDHSVINGKFNSISERDFDLWVQERGLYFPSSWSKEYSVLLSMNDKNESPKTGSLLTAPYEKGHYTYTGISFFRQLPAGVPGAFKLMVNLIER
jgi:LmbE family N-acetylglucosaminyl deacetylase